MDVRLDPEFERFVEEQVRSGRFASAADVLEAGLGRLMLELPSGPGGAHLPPPLPGADAALSAAAAAALGADGTIVGDLPCIRCRYNVRGLHADGRCPECGLAVRSTLNRDAVLSHSDVRWIGHLQRGTYLMAAAILAWAVPAFVACHREPGGYLLATLVFNGPRAWPLPFASTVREEALAGSLVLPGLAALLLHAAGVWHVAAREPAAADGEEGLTRRRALLLLAAVLPLGFALWWPVTRVATAGFYGWAFQPDARPLWAGAFALLDLAVHVLLFVQLRRLSTRVLDAALVRETHWFAAGTTASLAVIAAGCLLSGLEDGFAILVGVGSLGLTLCGMGTFILMFAFARAFRQAAAAGAAGEHTSYAAVAAGAAATPAA